MPVNRRIFVAAMLLVFALPLRASIFIDIKIFTGYAVKSFTFTPVVGKYSIFEADRKIGEVLKNETVIISVSDSLVSVSRAGVLVGNFTSVTISGSGLINAFKIKPANTGVKERIYDDDLKLSVVNGSLLILNHVNLEHYVAGVVQSEGGGSARDNDFYIVQAITCRTYALNNIKKHFRQGYNLCDSVHCQLYRGRCKSPEISQAVFSTAGDVIVDKDNKMISAAFHSNSGGQTVNSEDIWKIPTSYLKSVQDTFSLKMPNATWEYSMLTQNWLEYLANEYAYPVTDPVKKAAVLNVNMDSRRVFLVDSIPLVRVRNDLGLKSTFFNISTQGNYVVFRGRGYGHGVGLSQQGAIRMAQLGYSYIDIIRFYYKGVDVVNYDELMQKYSY